MRTNCDHRPLRISSPGPRPRGGTVSPQGEGEAGPRRARDTVAAALIDAGIRVCRITGSGEGRGVFCGMGICQECVMTVDGVRARACMTFVRDGMTVSPLREDEPLTVPPRVQLEPVALEAE